MRESMNNVWRENACCLIFNGGPSNYVLWQVPQNYMVLIKMFCRKTMNAILRNIVVLSQ